ncbi:MAG: hypothetical protein JNL83_14130 [Myxococcales bacterium]|nr:hypothetical protein [Myxococcales bacterium]
MKLLLAIAALATGCGGMAWHWEARAVVGAEAQRVPLAGLEEAAWLSIRGEGGDIAYPLEADGTELVLDSPFVAGALDARYNHWDAAAVMRSGLLLVPLDGPYPPPPDTRYPGDQALRGTFTIVVRDAAGAALATRTVNVSELIDPCGTTPITPLTATVAGFVVQILVQVSCQESIG